MQFRDLKRQYQALQTDIDKAISDVLNSSAFIMGDPVRQLEQELAEYVGVKHCLTCANGTEALTLALKALGIGKGDAVFVPDFTFFATAEVVALEGATPVFVDVNPDTFNMDARSLDDAVRAVHDNIIAVALFGLPADFNAIREVTKREGMYLIEDGAQGFGGAIRTPKPDGEGFYNRRTCSFGDISTTSFFPAKPLGCYGDGGAVFTNNDQWAEVIASFRVHGKGANKYDNVRIGMNSYFWMTGLWKLQAYFQHLYVNCDGAPVNLNDYELWVSLKFEGPSYYPGSGKTDGIWFDRVALRRR